MDYDVFHKVVEGLEIAQNYMIDQAFDELVRDYGQPVNVIEIGTHKGGFAVFLAQKFPDSNIHTFDPYEIGDPGYIRERNEIFTRYGITYYPEDCFLKDGRRIQELTREKTILLCDGAHKMNEFHFFSQKILPGSLIMAHDYGKNEDYFRSEIQGKYWTSSFEFDGSKVIDWCNENKLEPYKQDLFDLAVWFIRKKS